MDIVTPWAPDPVIVLDEHEFIVHVSNSRLVPIDCKSSPFYFHFSKQEQQQMDSLNTIYFLCNMFQLFY